VSDKEEAARLVMIRTARFRRRIKALARFYKLRGQVGQFCKEASEAGLSVADVLKVKIEGDASDQANALVNALSQLVDSVNSPDHTGLRSRGRELSEKIARLFQVLKKV
jgi:hypothetical protein